MSRHLASALCATVSLLAASAAAAPAFADAFASEAAPARTISVPKDKALSFRLDEPASKIVVSQPDIAEVVATTDRSFYVRGLDVGATNLLVYGPGGRLLQVIDVRVGYDAHALQSDIETAFPGEAVKVQTLGEGVLLTGTVSSNSIATRAKAMADKFAPNGSATSALLVSASQEVVLEVRVMEATRSALIDAGFAGNITSGNSSLSFGSGLIGNTPANGVLSLATHTGAGSLSLSLEALEEKGIVRTLAKPTLVAVSGSKASFLAGGEFPYPVPQGLNQITLEFRQYGVKLEFTPTVQDNGLIRLAVAPEVSQLDNANSLKINGVSVPGLITRKADTTVEIRDGDSLALGGLFLHTYNNDLRQFPGLGDIPILGALFRSSRWARNETELMIIVTPHVVTARDFERAKKTVDVAGQEPSTLNFEVNGVTTKDPPMIRDMRSAPEPGIVGPGVTAPAAVSAAKPAPLPLRGEIAPTVPASGK